MGDPPRNTGCSSEDIACTTAPGEVGLIIARDTLSGEKFVVRFNGPNLIHRSAATVPKPRAGYYRRMGTTERKRPRNRLQRVFIRPRGRVDALARRPASFLFFSSFYSERGRGRKYRLAPWRTAPDRSNYSGVSSSHAIGQRRSVSKEGDPRRSVDVRKGGLRANKVMLMLHSCCGARERTGQVSVGKTGAANVPREVSVNIRGPRIWDSTVSLSCWPSSEGHVSGKTPGGERASAERKSSYNFWPKLITKRDI